MNFESAKLEGSSGVLLQQLLYFAPMNKIWFLTRAI